MLVRFRHLRDTPQTYNFSYNESPHWVHRQRYIHKLDLHLFGKHPANRALYETLRCIHIIHQETATYQSLETRRSCDQIMHCQVKNSSPLFPDPNL